MAVKRQKATPRTGRRVPLARKGGSTPPARNSKKLPQLPKKKIKVPWHGIMQSFSVIIIGIICFFIFAAVSVSLVYGYRYTTTSPYFSLKSIEIQGNARMTSREILEISGLTQGVNTLALSISEVEGLIAASPWVEEVSVKRVLPDRLIVGIKERTPAFWVLSEGTMYYADIQGELIAPVAAEHFTSLPALEVEKGAEDVAGGLADLVASLKEAELPLDLQTISYVRLSASRGLEIYVGASRLKILVGLEEWLPNLERLGMTLSDLQRRGELDSVKEIKAQGSNVWVEKAAASAANG